MGIEPSAEAAGEARRRSGVDVLASTLEESSFQEGSFDVISMLGVMEHLHDPLGTLKLARSLLKPNGVLATYVPNFNYLRLKDTGLVCRLRNGCWSSLHPQEHLYHYTPATLTRTLETGGFALLRIDIGKPFSHGGALTRLAKGSAYLAVSALRALTGLHLGGIEAICRRVD
jgi:SAM-dependent methyltransferase